MQRVVVLGGGTGGTIVANRLRRRLRDEAEIHVVDRDDLHVYQPGLLFVPFGLADPGRLVRSRRAQLRGGIDFHEAPVDAVSLDTDEVVLGDGTRLPYDVLVIATGARLQPEEIEGLAWGGGVHTFYTRPGAVALAPVLREFRAGRLVVAIADMPIKCPVAPIEFVFLADWFLRERGRRDHVEIVLATPLDGCFTKPVASRHLTHLLDEKRIGLELEFAAGEVDADAGILRSYDEREVPFDLLVAIPPHGGAGYVERSPGLGDALGFVPTDPHTLQARARENVFVLGDATDLPSSKAGSVAHFESEVVVENVIATLGRRPLAPRFDGRSNCFIESGFGKALLIDFDYDTEPLPGRLGPLPLLRESRLNHLGKRAFEWAYWHALLPGRPLPLPQRKVAA